MTEETEKPSFSKRIQEAAIPMFDELKKDPPTKAELVNRARSIVCDAVFQVVPEFDIAPPSVDRLVAVVTAYIFASGQALTLEFDAIARAVIDPTWELPSLTTKPNLQQLMRARAALLIDRDELNAEINRLGEQQRELQKQLDAHDLEIMNNAKLVDELLRGAFAEAMAETAAEGGVGHAPA